MSDSDLEWYYPHADDLPNTNRAVTVLVALKNGEFCPDIGRYYGKDGWSLQFFTTATVVGWSNMPDFKDHVPVVEHDGPRGG